MFNLAEKKYDTDYYLSYLLFAYIILLMFFGRFDAFQQITIWVAGPIFSLAVLANYAKKPFEVPREVVLLGLFWLWVFPGYLVVVDFDGYFRHVRLLFTILVFFFCVEIVLIRTGKVKLIYQALVINGLLFIIYNYFSGGFSPEDSNEFWRLRGLGQTSNGFAIFSLVGLIGVLYLWNEVKSLTGKIFYIMSIVLFVGTIILTASRSSFITTILVFVFWLLFCYKDKFANHRFTFIFILILASSIVWIGYSYILDETYLGERFSRISESDEGLVGEVRVTLYKEGLEMFKESPFYGVGLSQFKERSVYNAYSHSLYMELLSTTGLGGFSIMAIFYFIIWRRVQKLKKVITNKTILYRLNFSSAVIISLVIFGLFNVSFLDIIIMLQLAIIGGYSNYLNAKCNEYLEEELEKEKYAEYIEKLKLNEG